VKKSHGVNALYLRAFNPTIVGIPPREDFYIGSASVKLFLSIFKMNFPVIMNIALSAQGVFHNSYS